MPKQGPPALFCHSKSATSQITVQKQKKMHGAAISVWNLPLIKQFLQHSGTFVFSALQSAGIGRLASKFFSVT